MKISNGQWVKRIEFDFVFCSSNSHTITELNKRNQVLGIGFLTFNMVNVHQTNKICLAFKKTSIGKSISSLILLGELVLFVFSSVHSCWRTSKRTERNLTLTQSLSLSQNLPYYLHVCPCPFLLFFDLICTIQLIFRALPCSF